jgi:hypothetical protein
MPGGLLTKRGLLLAKVETTSGEDALPVPALDAILVAEPNWEPDPQVLERDFVTSDLSKFEHVIGRVISGFSFTVMLAGNDRQQTGLVADAPMIARLLRGCGYALSSTNGSAEQNTTQVTPSKSNMKDTAVTFAKSGTLASGFNAPVLYTLEATDVSGFPGSPGEIEWVVTNNNPEQDNTAAVPTVIQIGDPIPLGSSGISLTPTVTTISDGDKWQVLVFPVGVKALPVSSNHETVTLYLYFDGLLHKGYAGMGTFTIEATAGDFARVNFQFTTTYVEPEDAPMPTDPVYETPLPPQVELSLLTWGGKTDLFAESWSVDAGNEIEARMDVNAIQGYRGSRINDRAPAGGFTPEATLEADEPFWRDYLRATAKTFTVRCGTERGNQIVMFAPNAQTSEQSYADRNGLRAYDKSVMFKRGQTGNDELMFVFC